MSLADADLLQADELADAVVDVDDEVADLEVAQVREERGCGGSLAGALLRRGGAPLRRRRLGGRSAGRRRAAGSRARAGRSATSTAPTARARRRVRPRTRARRSRWSSSTVRSARPRVPATNSTVSPRCAAPGGRRRPSRASRPWNSVRRLTRDVQRRGRRPLSSRLELLEPRRRARTAAAARAHDTSSCCGSAHRGARPGRALLDDGCHAVRSVCSTCARDVLAARRRSTLRLRRGSRSRDAVAAAASAVVPEREVAQRDDRRTGRPLDDRCVAGIEAAQRLDRVADELEARPASASPAGKTSTMPPRSAELAVLVDRVLAREAGVDQQRRRASSGAISWPGLELDRRRPSSRRAALSRGSSAGGRRHDDARRARRPARAAPARGPRSTRKCGAIPR